MRWLIGAALVVAMLAFGIGFYHAAGYLKGDRPVARRPTQVLARPLPGTMYLVQSGAIYRFQHGSFTEVTDDDGWMQPAAKPGGSELVAVRREPNYSDLYLLSTAGKPMTQLTHNSVPGPAVENNHWSFYPRFSGDGSTLFYDYDAKDLYNPYRVDLAIFASPSDPASRGSVQWTDPNQYTGGDVNPVPLQGGGLVYTKYSIDDSFQVHAQIWAQKRQRSAGKALTEPQLGCGQPAISPDEKLIAMVCTKGSNQSAELDVAPFDPATLTLGSPATLVSGQLVSAPAFSPDGKTIAYLAPSAPGGAFQLWTVTSSGSASERAITTDLGLDSTSAPVWLGG
jgi:Tol biopolymer transport system component